MNQTDLNALRREIASLERERQDVSARLRAAKARRRSLQRRIAQEKKRRNRPPKWVTPR